MPESLYFFDRTPLLYGKMIDVDRLLTGYTIATYTSEDNKPCQVAAYKKSVLSVIENVAYANDLERRWIQNNPTVAYDCKLIELTFPFNIPIIVFSTREFSCPLS